MAWQNIVIFFLDIFPIEALKPGRLAKLHKTDKWIDL